LGQQRIKGEHDIPAYKIEALFKFWKSKLERERRANS
jgi:hypothetical protein